MLATKAAESMNPQIRKSRGEGARNSVKTLIAKRGISYALAIMLIAGTFFGFGWSAPEAAYADSNGATIDVSDETPDASGDGWTYAGNIFTITNGANVTVTGTTTTNRILVAIGATATVTLNNASIDVSATTDACAFDTNGATVTLKLSGENTLKSNGSAAGLQVNEGATLTITSASGDGSEEGKLTAHGQQSQSAAGNINTDHSGVRGAGIGGATATNAGTITINGGTIEARGAYDSDGSGAGIGGGGAQQGSSQTGGTGGVITINGGKIDAYGSSNTNTSQENGGAAIGGGGGHNEASDTGGHGGNITINGGTVTATGMEFGAGIGGGMNAKDSGNQEITIIGGTITATANRGGAGIGGGGHGEGGTIKISGGTITATNMNGGAGIGGGAYGDGGTIEISGGNVTATSNTRAAAIGGGLIGDGACSSGIITISGGVVVAKNNSAKGVAIGGGARSGDTGYGGYPNGIITITGGSVYAYTSGTTYNPPAIGGDDASGATKIDISGGTVVAMAASSVGIGGTSGTGAGVVTISGGTVISGGIGASDGTTISDGAFVFTKSLSNPQTNNGITIIDSTMLSLIDNDITLVKVTLKTDLTIPEGSTLTIPEGCTLVVSDGITLTNEGTINNAGTITSEDDIVNEGIIANAGDGDVAGEVTGNSVKTAVTAVTISGTVRVGQTLTATATPEGATVDYQWKADEGNVGTNSKTYTPTSNEVGKTITVTVTGTGEYALEATSSPTAAVASDITAPTVSSVAPTGTGKAIAGNVVVTFSEAMDAAAGIVKLNNESALTGGAWSEGNTVYTIPYSGLDYSTQYTVKISGFKDVAENEMAAVTSGYTFTTVVAPDTTAPVLTPGAVVRISDTAATVKFTSNEAGTYYYEVVEEGAGEPTIDTSEEGTDCTTDEMTISLTSLTVGAKDIYIKVKDAAGNVSDALKIDIEVYVSPYVPPQVTKVTSVTIAGAPAKFAYKAVGVKTLQLRVNVLPATAANKTVTWKSSNTKIASVTASGLVTFVGAEGPVIITATAADGSGKSAAVTISSVKNVTGIRTPLATVYVKKGTKNFVLPVVLDDSTNKKVAVTSKLTWKSSNTKAVTVTQKGKITVAKKLKKKTTVKITVTAANGKSKVIKVIAVPKATKLKKVTSKMPKKNTLKVGATYQLKPALNKKTATNVKVTFKSSKASVVKVDKAGKLIALKKGTAKITITAGSKKFTKTITVKK